jgi:ribosomal subunit interface protein
MQNPLQISFHGLDASEAVETRVRERVARLERHHGRITACRVVIESGHRHGRKGNLFRVAIDVSVPGAEIVVNRAPDRDKAHADVYVAIRDAFDAADRQLAEHFRRRRGEVKAHREPEA